MEIKKNDLTRLRNEELFQFAGEFKRLAEEAGVAALNIQELFAVFVVLLGKLNAGLDYIRKSEHTQKIFETDYQRDSIYRGFVLLTEAYLHSRNDNKVRASENIRVVIDAFGDFRNKPYNEETATITNFLDDIRTRCSAAIELLGAREWIDDLAAVNKEFNELMNIRFDERAEQEYVNIRNTRRELETTYGKIVERIHAGIIFNGEAGYKSFVDKLNERVVYYKNTLAQRQGAANKNKENKQAEKTKNEE